MRLIDADALVADLNKMVEECIAMEKHVPTEFKQYYRGKFEAVMDIILQVSRHTPTIDCVPRQQWISVEDRLPDEGKDVMCYLGDAIFKFVTVGYLLDCEWRGDGFPLRYATHWMPLPEPPKEG